LPDYLVRGNRVALLVQLKECKDWTGTRREVARWYE
jgi:dTDP-4-amino-4,6-dideoxygalactose transaminase